jgi:DMSO/TMAO reductase YedYZ molybdopterin-dependent catalytic subunit
MMPDKQDGSRPAGRRAFHRAAVVAAPGLCAGRVTLGITPAEGAGRAKADSSGGLITREHQPQNLEFLFAGLNRFVTPNALFYVRNHFKQPELDPRDWLLKIEGAVEHTLELTYDELLKMASRTQPVTLECAGNGRVLLTPKEAGAQWELGAVSNAEWSGVPLAAVLDRAGVRPGAVEVLLEGADKGESRDEPKSPGEIQYARSVPLEKARRDVLLAHRMNGEPLPAAHGFPLRALVPGWYGMASVKWLTRIVVLDRPFHGFFQSLQYTYWERVNGAPTLTPITQLQVKAEISRPGAYEVVAAGKSYRVHGAAWTGDGTVTKVELSVDGGKSWQTTRLIDDAVPYAWRRWEYEWRTPARAGKQRLMARATDSQGRTQPLERDRDRRNYMISHVLPIDVEVR